MEKQMIEENKIKYELANKIWHIPFAVCNLDKLKKRELILLCTRLVEDLDTRINKVDSSGHYCDERDWKDLLFDEKCIMIESLYPNFFNEESSGGEK